MTSLKAFLKWLTKPLRSRKVRAAFATVVAAYLVDTGFEVSEKIIIGILGLGAVYIGGVAVEDHGRNMVTGGEVMNGPTAGEDEEKTS